MKRIPVPFQLVAGVWVARTNWRRSVSLALGIGLLVAVAHAQDSSGEASQKTQLERAIEFPAISDQEIVRVAFDREFYERARTDRHDVRVVNRVGDEVPFLIRRQLDITTRTVPKFWTVQGADLQPSPDVGLVIRFQLDKDDPQPTGLRIVTPLKDFEQTLQLFAVDGADEVQIAKDEVLFDYSKYMNVRRVEISIPPTSARSFRLVIGSPTLDQESIFRELTNELQAGREPLRREEFRVERRPFRIDRLELWQNIEQVDTTVPVTIEYPLVVHATEQDAERKETRIRLSTHQAPLQRIEVETTSKNFSRQARVLAPDDAGKFMVVAGTARIHRLSFRTLQPEELKVPIASVEQHDELELVLENRDSPPLELATIRGFGFVDEVVFFAEPGDEYRLIYAGLLNSRPDYDMAALNAVLADRTVPLSATLGPVQETVASLVGPPRGLADLLNQPWVVGSIIVLLVIVLGWFLFSAAQRIDTTAPPLDNEPPR